MGEPAEDKRRTAVKKIKKLPKESLDCKKNPPFCGEEPQDAPVQISNSDEESKDHRYQSREVENERHRNKDERNKYRADAIPDPKIHVIDHALSFKNEFRPREGAPENLSPQV